MNSYETRYMDPSKRDDILVGLCFTRPCLRVKMFRKQCFSVKGVHNSTECSDMLQRRRPLGIQLVDH